GLLQVREIFIRCDVSPHWWCLIGGTVLPSHHQSGGLFPIRNDSLGCKFFPGTLRGVAMHWLATLPGCTIPSFNDLTVLQTKGKSLKSYLVRLNNTTVRINDLDKKFFVKALQKWLRAGQFSDALALRRPNSMREIRARVEKHIEVEEDVTDLLEAERQPVAL
ncbi:hypothetical protein CR513_53913, partial [Mucuna pruriens]